MRHFQWGALASTRLDNQPDSGMHLKRTITSRELWQEEIYSFSEIIIVTFIQSDKGNSQSSHLEN